MNRPEPEHRIFLLDGMALVYRAHFAFAARPILTSDGRNSSALFGFVNTLIDLMRTGQPTHMAVAFDTAEPTARHERFPAYKAQRQEMPEDLADALPHVRRLLEAFRIPVLLLDGYEADDIIGTIARRAKAIGPGVTYMVTPDKDFAQLVDDRTFIWKPGRQGSEHEVIGPAEVREVWQVERPGQVVDVLALWGDASDNIPGVPGIGEKTAKSLIARFGSVEGVLAGLDQLKGKQKENLAAFADQARLCRELAEIITDVPLEVDFDSLLVQPMDEEAVKAIFTEFEFNTLGRRLFGDGFRAGRGYHRRAVEAAKTEAADVPPGEVTDPARPPAPVEPPERSWRIVSGAAACREAVAGLGAGGLLGFAVALDSADVRAASIRAVALAPHDNEAVALTGVSGGELVEILGPMLRGREWTLAGHDLKDGLQALILAGADVRCPLFDTFIAAALIDPEQKRSLEWLSESMLGRPLTAGGPVAEGGQLLMAGLVDEDAPAPADPLVERALERAGVARELVATLRPALTERGQDRVFHEIESPLLPVLARMEAAGIRLNPTVLREASSRLEGDLARLEELIFEQAGGPFNLASPKQLGEVLFDRLQLVARPRKTKTGQYVTNEEVLSELAGAHPIVANLLAWREASKLKSTYVDALPGTVSPRTGRIHTTLHQVHAATGRLASNNPNLQNIPIRTGQGRAIRRAFVVEDAGWIFYSADYSQIELRIMAHLSGDAHLREAFHQGLDIHTATAARVHGVALEDVDPAMRRAAKMVNFGIIYGISAFGLARRLGIPRAEAARLIEEYFVRYPGVKAYMDETIAGAEARGYVETLTGRRRYLRDIHSRNATIRSAAGRTAINSPIQGSAADMIKIAMVRIDDELHRRGLRTRMILQVHDELLFEVPLGEREVIREIVPRLMRDALPLSVPVVVDTGEGKDWFEAHA